MKFASEFRDPVAARVLLTAIAPGCLIGFGGGGL